ncbi:MAG: hypothetical protein HGB05_22040, partial [Chloroflexi bacterium]|nr:hypothetical protein [Chloroflexota bacterium]
RAYPIRLKGPLGSEWAAWFDGLSITLEDNGTTLLTGAVIDQAALHGLLKRVRDLGLTLISINPIDPDHSAVVSGDPNQSFTQGHAR